MNWLNARSTTDGSVCDVSGPREPNSDLKNEAVELGEMLVPSSQQIEWGSFPAACRAGSASAVLALDAPPACCVVVSWGSRKVRSRIEGPIRKDTGAGLTFP